MQSKEAQIEMERRERVKHQEILKDLRAVLTTPYGKNFIKYLFESFSVGEFPEVGAHPDFLREQLGYLRSGNAIFKIVSEANPEVAAMLLAQIEKEKHVQEFNDQIQPG